MKALPFSILIFLFLAAGTIAYSQDYIFKVASMRGQTEIKTTEGWVKLIVGAELAAEDSIKIGDNSYLGLLHKDGTSLEWRSPGTYKINDIKSKKTVRLKEKKSGGNKKSFAVVCQPPIPCRL